MHYVIIGNGGAGVSALQAIRDADKTSDVTIISREQYPAYSPCSLPNLIGGEVDKPSIFRFDKQFYNRLNARFMKNIEATQAIVVRAASTSERPVLSIDIFTACCFDAPLNNSSLNLWVI